MYTQLVNIVVTVWHITYQLDYTVPTCFTDGEKKCSVFVIGRYYNLAIRITFVLLNTEVRNKS